MALIRTGSVSGLFKPLNYPTSSDHGHGILGANSLVYVISFTEMLHFQLISLDSVLSVSNVMIPANCHRQINFYAIIKNWVRETISQKITHKDAFLTHFCSIDIIGSLLSATFFQFSFFQFVSYFI